MSVILLTGGTGGLGRAVTERFLEKGHQVVATVGPGHALDSRPNLEGYALDLLDEAGCRQLVADTVARKGGIDAAVLLVGGFAMGSIADTDFAGIEEQFRLNFQTAYQVVRPVFEQMLRQPDGGRIVLIGSRPAVLPAAGQHMVAYALSKSLLFSLSDILNAAGKEHNVVSTVVAPSTIDTPLNRKEMPDVDFSKWVNPADLAEIIEFVTVGAGRILREPVLKAYHKA